MPSKHLGNLLLSLRAIQGLVDHFGADRCTLVIDAAYRDIMAAANLGARVLYFPRRDIEASGLAGKIHNVLNFVAASRRPRPALAIAVEGEVVSQRFLPLSGCRISVGPDNRFCRRYRVRLPLDRQGRHEFFHYEAVARQVTGIPLPPGYPLLSPSTRALAQVDTLLADSLAEPARPLAILHPCATKAYKQWPVAHFAAVADDLAARGANVVITGAGDFDGATIARLMDLCRRPPLSLHDRLDLGQLIALMSRARLFVGNDTGPTHLAAACGTPGFALFGPTDEHLWGPLGDRTTILRSTVPCEPDCLRRLCAVDYRCMRTLATDTVTEALAPWL